MTPEPQSFSYLTIEMLEREGFAPDLVEALEDSFETEPGSIAFLFGLRNQEPVRRELVGGTEVGDWPEGLKPGVWWPAGRVGRHVIVCAGAHEAIFLASLLFSVGPDGELVRRTDVSDLLSNATIVALPNTLAFVSAEWYADPAEGVTRLLEEIVVEERETVFLSVPRIFDGLHPGALKAEGNLSGFIDHFMDVGESYGIRPCPALSPWMCPWSALLADFRGAAQRAALGGIFDYWNALSGLAPDRWKREEMP